MHAHRVEVLDRADDHDVVAAVAHHLELELVPAARPTPRRAPGRSGSRAGPISTWRRSSSGVSTKPPPWPPSVNAGRTTAGSATPSSSSSDVTIRDDGTCSPTALHGLAEELAVLGAADHVDRRRRAARRRAPRARPPRASSTAEVEGGLAAQRRQQRVRPLAAEHVGDALEVERLEVGAVGEPGVGHDRRRVRVDDDRPVAVLAQHLQRLAAGVVELARLPDHDRPGADHADRAQIVRLGRHRTSSTQRSRIGHASCGPGPASGWNCTDRARSSGKSKPSTVPS